MLLLLKKYLREAYRLTDERVLAFAPNNTAVRKVEEKALASKVWPLTSTMSSMSSHTTAAYQTYSHWTPWKVCLLQLMLYCVYMT
jgi:hypothetical protein